MRRRVAVTGIGAVSSIGSGAEELWRACLEGATRVEPIPEIWREYYQPTSSLWSPLPAVDYGAYGIRRIEILQHDPSALIGMVAALQALDDAGLAYEIANDRRNTYRVKGVDPERAMVTMGTGVGGLSSLYDCFANHTLSRQQELLAKIERQLPAAAGVAAEVAEMKRLMRAPPRMNRFAVPMGMPNSCSSALGIKLSITGPCQTFCSACAAGTVAIGHAFRSLASGRCDLALAGGTEFLDDLYGAIFRGFDMVGALVQDCDDPQRANRPFDRGRSGFLFSQGGAAVLVLEDLERARRRDAPILAEIAGFAETSDAHHMFMIEPSGRQIRRVIEEALDDAGLRPEEIDYVNAHGTGTVTNDQAEAAVLERIFGRRVLVNSTKSLLGHTIGASGAIEAAVTALSIRHRKAHPSLNLDEPIADLGFVRRVEERPIRAAISPSLGFGGHNAALVLKHV